MARDSLFDETILWRGRPAAIVRSGSLRAVTLVATVAALVSLCFAITLATTLDVRTGGLLILAAWCSTLALLSWRLPVFVTEKLEYLVTDKHVIWRCGRLRRSIARESISYSLVRWSGDGKTGDLVLVRAVPIGALRRTLQLTLHAVEAPDRVLSLIRGVDAGAPLGSGRRPLTQRLDDGERVLWSGVPHNSRWTARRGVGVLLAASLFGIAAHAAWRALPALERVLELHALTLGQAFLLASGVILGIGLLAAVAVGAGWAAGVRPTQLVRKTRYFVTDKRVLIRRGREELALDRSRIAYVIAAPASALPGRRAGLKDVFLVLDGPAARALAPSGAFGGESDDVLRPVLAAIDDADTVDSLLRAA